MTIMVDIARAEFDLVGLIDKVESGGDVILTRGDAPVARLTPISHSPESQRHTETVRAVEGLRKVRASIAPTTIEEILAWRDEGRK